MPEMELADDGLIPPTFITVEEAAKNIRKDAQYVFFKGLKRGLSFYAKPELAGYEAILIPEIDDSPLPNNFSTSRRLLPKSGRYDFVKIPSDSIKSIIHVKKSIKLNFCQEAHHSIDHPCEGFKWFVNLNALQISEHEILVKASDVSLYFSPIGNTIEIVNKITDPLNKAYNAIEKSRINIFRPLFQKNYGADYYPPETIMRIKFKYDLNRLFLLFSEMVKLSLLEKGADNLVYEHFTNSTIPQPMKSDTQLFNWLSGYAEFKKLISELEIDRMSAKSHFLKEGKVLVDHSLRSGPKDTDTQKRQKIHDLVAKYLT